MKTWVRNVLLNVIILCISYCKVYVFFFFGGGGGGLFRIDLVSDKLGFHNLVEQEKGKKEKQLMGLELCSYMGRRCAFCGTVL